MFSSPLISMRTVAAVSFPETTVAWSSSRTSWLSPAPVTNVMASQETDGYLAASRRIAPSSVWSYSMSNSSLRPERSVFGRCFRRRWLKIVVSVPPPQHREIFGGLKDARDGDTRRRGGGGRGGRAPAREALQLEVAARVEDPEGFYSHRN